MARLPNIQGARSTPRPSRAIASISPNAAAVTGEALEGFGQEINRFGEVLFDRETTAEATERDTMVSNQIRDLIYNPETGFTGMKGNQAVAGRQATIEKLEALKSTAYDGLNATARRKLESSLTRRISGAMDTVERHTLGERDNWLAGASAARVEAAYQDSLFNPADTAASLSVIENETRAQGLREGWGAERTNVEIAAKRSKLFSDQVTRIAASDPIAAMQYMRDNQDKMVASDVVNIETRLQPEIKRAVGRQKGAQASFSGVGDQYLSSIRAAESGGNDAAKNPLSSATGRYQFIKSTWDQLIEKNPGLGLTPNGRLDPIQNEIAIRAFTAENAKTLKNAGIPPTNGNLYAAHFLGAGGATKVLGSSGGTLMTDVVSDSVIRANPFLAKMDVNEFKMWANSKFDDGAAIGFSDGAPGIESLVEIKDPIERKAAMDEYNLRASISEGQRKQVRAAAQDAAFQMIEAGGNLDDVPLEYRQALGQTAMTSLRSYQSTLASGDQIQTDPERYYELRQMRANNPQEFKNLNLVEDRDKLDEGDWKEMVDAQTKPSSDIKGRAASTLMSTASRKIAGAGIDPSPKVGSDDAKTVDALQSNLVRWQDDFIEKNNRTPTPTEMDEEISNRLVEVVIKGPKMFGDNQQGPAFNINYGGATALPNDDMTLDEFFESEIQIKGIEVTEETKLLAIELLSTELGREVTPQDVVTFLIQQDLY